MTPSPGRLAPGRPAVAAIQTDFTRNRRRYQRWSIDLEARVYDYRGGETTISLLNLSRGGVLLCGSGEIKSVLFRSKRYTHRPVPVTIFVEEHAGYAERYLQGRCRYLRKMPDGSYQSGFAFSSLQDCDWISAVAQAHAPVSCPPARLSLRPRHPGYGPAPVG